MILFKDIVVNLSAGKSGKIVGDYAISLPADLKRTLPVLQLPSSWIFSVQAWLFFPSKKSKPAA
jgi:hypothetical protein